MPSHRARFSWLIIAFAAFGGILYGYDLGIIAGAILFIRKTIPMTDTQSSFLVAAVLGGGAIATLVSGTLADWFGRKKMIIAAAVIFLAGVFSLAFANTYSLVLIGRLTQGVGVGIITIIIPLYLAESLPPEVRGRGVSAFQLMLTFGILMASLVGLYYTHSGNWRGMFLSAAVPGVILLIGGFLLPNSPRWLFRKGRVEQALAVLKKTRADDHAHMEIKEMQELIKQGRKNFSDFFAALTQKRYLMPALIVFAVAALQQFMGINSILQFSAFILKGTGLNTNITAMLGSTAITAVNFVMTIIAFFLVDRLGRKFLLTLGTLGCTVFLFFLGSIHFILPSSHYLGYLMLTGILGFVISYAVGPGVCVWLVISELMPERIRSTGMSVALFLNSIVSTLFASAFLPLMHRIGYSGVFMMCAVAALLYFIIALKVVPETKNKTLEEIEMEFSEHRSAAEIKKLHESGLAQ
jgi:MFS transporter, SP family, galactose:H+ symporter